MYFEDIILLFVFGRLFSVDWFIIDLFNVFMRVFILGRLVIIDFDFLRKKCKY